ncbi:MAG: hydroxyacylglutathione hydrolase [Geminicoccaceae bacterium]|nr:hydroxyacylglutathione hydrolase [Geminicoccaceae bacterium]
MTALEIEVIPALGDNYVFLIENDGRTVVVDPGEAAPVLRRLQSRNLRLDEIWITHRHGDHTGGVAELVGKYGCKVVGPAAEAGAIGGLDVGVEEGDSVGEGTMRAEVIATPGHTEGHISYHLPEAKALFCGDTLFVMGCGRLSGDVAPTMWRSLQKLAALPEGTRVYCGHEYTLANARFAVSVDGDNQDLQAKARLVGSLRDQGQPTVPSTIGEERRTNPFLRAGEPALRRSVGMTEDADAAEVFGALRRRKDRA